MICQVGEREEEEEKCFKKKSLEHFASLSKYIFNQGPEL
jgi:hypothetical protein